jgi:hypothetical protein
MEWRTLCSTGGHLGNVGQKLASLSLLKSPTGQGIGLLTKRAADALDHSNKALTA